jgi:hypothetical protein
MTDTEVATTDRVQQPEPGTANQIKDKAGDVTEQAQEKAQEAAGQARDKVRDQIEQRSTEVGRKIGEQGSGLRSVGASVCDQGQDRPAKLADQAAHHVERVSNWLTDSDADRILHDIEDAARSNPWAVMAGGIALGFVASRFLKASSSDRYQARSADRYRVPSPDRRAVPSTFAPPDFGNGATVGAPGSVSL